MMRPPTLDERNSGLLEWVLPRGRNQTMDVPQKPDPDPTASRPAKARQMGLNGLQASTMGLVMVGCITAGFLLGQWLDARFHTAYWMPILVVLGVIAGFREMFLTVVSINRQSQSLLEQSRRERAERAADNMSRAGQSSAESALTEAAPGAEGGEAVETQRARPRVFKVPPPPQPSFARRAGNEAGDASGDQIGSRVAVDRTEKQGAAARMGNAPGTAQSEDEPLADAAEFARLTEDVDMLKKLLSDDQEPSREEKQK